MILLREQKWIIRAEGQRKEGKMSFSYENQGSASFLVYEMEESEQLDEIGLGMLKNNQLPCVLPVAYVQVDDRRNLRWNISSKIDLESFLNGTINRTRLLNVFSSICDAVESAEDYLLDDKLFCLDKKYIFCDVSTGRTSLLYIPIIREGEALDILSFARSIMLAAHFQESEDNGYVATLMNNLNRPSGLTVPEFGELVRELKAKTDQPMGRSIPGGRVPLPPKKDGFGTAGKPVTGGWDGQQVPGQNEMNAFRGGQEAFYQTSVDRAGGFAPQDSTTLLNPQMKASGSYQPGKTPQEQWGGQSQFPDNSSHTWNVDSQNHPTYGAQSWNNAGQSQPFNGGQVWNVGGQNQPSNGGQAWKVGNQSQPFNNGGQSWNAYDREWNANASQQNQPFSGGGREWNTAAQNQPQPNDSRSKGVPYPRVPFGQGRGRGDVPPSGTGRVPVNGSLENTTILNPAAGVDPSYTGGEDTTFLNPNMIKSDTTILTPAGMPQARVEGVHVAVASVRRVRTGQNVDIRKDLFHIGTEQSYADFCIKDNAAISRSHADIICRDNKYFIKDTNSLNHTYLNGSMLTSNTEYELRSGDSILLANEEFEFKVR